MGPWRRYRTDFWRRSGLVGVVLAGCLVAGLTLAREPAARAQTREVDLALVLAIDCSYSVDAHEFGLQMDGLARAFRQRAVHEAIESGPLGRIAVAVIEWSDDQNQTVAVPWVIIDSPSSALVFADIVAGTQRRLGEGGTAIGAAMMFGALALGSAPFSAARRVIDISSDGRNNRGERPNLVRDRLAAEGITINALTILNEWPTLDKYFERHVVAGPGHFVVIANDYDAYGEAILRKLVKEITGPGIS